MMALPAGDLTLTDKRETTRTLLSAGVDIHGLNTVRKHLSGIKGGRLAVAARSGVMTLAVSDVVDDDISVIGSGPTVPDPTTSLEALALLDRFGGRDLYPRRVVEWLRQTAEGSAEETPKPTDPRFRHLIARVIGGAINALEGGRAGAELLGYHAHVLDEPVAGEARLAAMRYFQIALDVSASLPRPSCILSAGETTVHVTGGGKGGRNQEFALALAESVSGMVTPAVVASIGTDGIDGPTDAAGGIVDVSTLARARAQRLESPQQYLENNNAYAFFDALGDLIRTGPTTTNVADVQIMLIA
jgi:hydroxypyruvate reductase